MPLRRKRGGLKSALRVHFSDEKKREAKRHSENLHEALGRIGGVAILDLVGTVVGGIVLSNILGVSKVYTIPAVFAMGFYTHQILGIKTRWNRYSFVKSAKNASVDTPASGSLKKRRIGRSDVRPSSSSSSSADCSSVSFVSCTVGGGANLKGSLVWRGRFRRNPRWGLL